MQYPPIVDLHTHSTASDGTYTPAEAAELAKKAGLSAIALTDHDTIDGLAEFQKKGAQLGLETIPGIEFAAGMLAELDRRGGRLFLLGAKPGVAEKAAQKLQETYPGLKIAGTHDGYFKEEGPVVEAINAAHPDALLVCLGAPKQEYFMETHDADLEVPVMAGLGGSMDVLAGNVQRAPEFYQKHGLEWLYRLVKEPQRWRRMIKLPLYLLDAVVWRIKGGR
jgi:N-acetylglucosaminyldiphosphoundecaprenol N-acetyl-beta-D-mannosaminyltransferase